MENKKQLKSFLEIPYDDLEIMNLKAKDRAEKINPVALEKEYRAYLQKEKRIKAVEKQILSHENKIKTEKPKKDTTIDYWKKEIEEGFKKIKEDDEKYLEEHKD